VSAWWGGLQPCPEQWNVDRYLLNGRFRDLRLKAAISVSATLPFSGISAGYGIRARQHQIA
jgi:hypothetical protein